MKQSEKLDIILKELYEKRDERKPVLINELVKSAGLEVSQQELIRLCRKLKEDHYIALQEVSNTRMMGRITAEGISYCEEDSYSQKGQSVLNVTHNYTITGSPQANIVINSSQVTINQSQEQDASGIIEEIRQVMERDGAIDFALKEEIAECLDEIKLSIDAGKQPKFSMRQLLTMGSEIASIGGLVVNLAQVLGIMSQSGM